MIKKMHLFCKLGPPLISCSKMVRNSEYSLELEVEWIRPFIRINIKKLDKNFAPGRTERTINCLQTVLELLGKGLYSLI